MLREHWIQRWVCGSALLCVTVLATTAFAGIPEPGIVLRGKVLNDNDELITSGTLQWTFTPQGTGDPVTLQTELGTFEGDGGPYSYQVIVPLETRVSGFPNNPKALPINSTTTFAGQAEVLNTSIDQRRNFVIDADSRGRIIRADVGCQDDDNDTLCDDWEITFFGNLSQGPEGDFDMDGLTNFQEFDLGTDPTKEDTDGDGFTDIEEIANGTDPLIPTPTISGASPDRAWLFGGAVAHITGTGFTTESTVLFNGVEAQSASGETNTATDLYVVVPPLYDPPTTSGAEVEVDVTVQNSTESDTATYTYVRYAKAAESNGAVTGDVTTNAYVFTREDGSGNLTLVLDGDNPDTNGVLNIPATGNVGTGDIFAIVRATMTPELAGITSFPGDAIDNAWNFSIHLYDSDPPFTEYNNVGFAEGNASLTFPIDESDISTAEVEAGEIGLFSIATDFDYAFGDTAHTVTGSEAEGQYTVRATDLVNNGDSISVQMNHFSAFALRRGVEEIDPVVNEVQTLTIDATGGTFTLTFDGETTGELGFDITAEELQAALESLSNIGDGNVSVSQNDDGSFSITFTGDLGGQDMPELEGDDSALTGGDGLTVVTSIEGRQTALQVSPSSRTVNAAGGMFTLAVFTGDDQSLGWTAAVTSGSEFLSIAEGSSGTGDGTITFNASENTADSAREGTIRVTAGDDAISVAITQNPVGVGTLLVEPSALQQVEAAGGTLEYTVTNTGSTSITWTATVEEGADFLTITTGATGTDGGSIVVEVAENTGTTNREGMILVSGSDLGQMVALQIQQDGMCTGCNCPDGGGCNMSKDAIIHGFEKTLGDLFLFGLAIVTMLGLGLKGGA